MSIVIRLSQRTFRRAVRGLCAADCDLAAVVARWGPPPFWTRPPGFATLVLIVLEQQVSLASARSTFSRIETAAGAVTPESLLQLGREGLRRLGVTRQKAEYCCNLAALVTRGELDLARLARAGDAEARERLITIRGIGPWTADIYLLAALRRPDIWPDGDLALVEAARRVKRLRAHPDRKRLRRIAAPWQPWRAVAARILWHHYLCQKRQEVLTRA